MFIPIVELGQLISAATLAYGALLYLGQFELFPTEAVLKAHCVADFTYAGYRISA